MSTRRPVMIAVLGLLSAIAPPSARAESPAEALDAILAPLFPPGRPGVAALVRKGETVLLRRGYGLADVEAGTPIRPEMLFRLGSVTKQFTAAAIMMLVEEGRVSLSDDVRKYVPQFPAHPGTVTIEHLLTHTSGVPSYTDQPAFGRRLRDDLGHEEVLALIKDLPLDFPPGTKWKYSNSGYYLLGMVIEKASGQSYAAFVTERIFKPTGMVHSGYGDGDRGGARQARGYDGSAAPRVASPMSMKAPFAAGALVSSVDDLALWDAAIAGGKLLSLQSWSRVFAPAKLKDGQSTTYGFGWGVITRQGVRVQQHNGGILGFSSTILRLPEEKVLVVLLCNAQPPPSSLEPLAFKLAMRAAGKSVVEPKTVKVDPGLLASYAGVYVFADKRRAVVRQAGDHLTIQPGGGPLFEAWPESETAFFVKEPPLRFRFHRDAKGQVSGGEVERPDGSIQRAQRTSDPPPAEGAAKRVR